MNPKRIILMRHALAVDSEKFKGPDSQRPITRKGVKHTKKVIRFFFKNAWPSRVFSSDFVRAVQTAKIAVDELTGVKGKIIPLHQMPALRPLANVDDWKTSMKKFDDKNENQETWLVVGHEPCLSKIVLSLLGIERGIETFKKSGIAAVKRIGNSDLFELTAFLEPKILKKHRRAHE